jgi:ribonucleoside-diphosphate reductase alpha chain
MLRVMRKHRQTRTRSTVENVPTDLMREARRQSWDEASTSAKSIGYRNSQVTVLAPTGTIGFMMDCDTTGIEPDIALIKYKKLVGGGMIKIVNQTVPIHPAKLGYTRPRSRTSSTFIDEKETIEGAPHLKDEHLPSSTAPSRPPTASAPSTTWATSR